MSFRAVRPVASEHAPFYSGYVAQVPEGDVLQTLAAGAAATSALLASADHARETFRYAPEKWSVRQVVGHLADAERVFSYRMLRFSRGDATPLAGFDENAFAGSAPHHRIPLSALIEELSLLRGSTLALLSQLDAEAWGLGGEANGHHVTVRALAWITAGHELHHRGVLAERYGLTPG